jgi:hypothetical protein
VENAGGGGSDRYADYFCFLKIALDSLQNIYGLPSPVHLLFIKVLTNDHVCVYVKPETLPSCPSSCAPERVKSGLNEFII